MSTRNSLTTSLQTAISGWAGGAPGLVEVHLFGSALHGGQAGDIDLIVVYDGDVVPAARSGELREGIRDAIREATDLKTDITLLSRGEASETEFADLTDAIQLWPQAGDPERGP